jgi:hypothetical protein
MGIEEHMKIIGIEYPTPLSEIEDVENGNVDVFVKLEDGMTYTVVVNTPKNLAWYMNNENINFIPASSQNIIVKKLTEDIIKEALEDYVRDEALWLKLAFLSLDIKNLINQDFVNEKLAYIKKTNEELL